MCTTCCLHVLYIHVLPPGLMASATGGSAADAPRVSGDTHLRDSDENKYRRKGPLELLGQWIRCAHCMVENQSSFFPHS